MNKLVTFLCVLAFFVSACGERQSSSAEEISPNKIYLFFSNSCPHCHDALAYINREHPNLKVAMVNVADPVGYKLFVKCAQKFKLGRNIGTPLFCMGDNYLMGWAPEYENKFDEYSEPFQKH